MQSIPVLFGSAVSLLGAAGEAMLINQRDCGAVNRLVANLPYPAAMMTPRQIDLVQDSFAQVLPITGEAAAYFYDRLFALAPGTRSLFDGDMAEQGRKLFQTLALVVDALAEIDSVLPVARALAIRHVGYGVREEHYAAVGAALIDTLRYGLGRRFDDETETGWAGAYRLLSHHMILAARTVDQSSVAA